MGFLTIFTIFFIAAVLAERWKEDFYDIFPMVVSGLILIMYVFAFGKGLVWIDFLSCGVLAGILFAAFFRKKEGKRPYFIKVCKILFSAKSLLLLVAMVTLTFLLKDKAALWWDDVNYWAVDAKALYYNGGFAGKYANVAPEFGDYPPALQLFKWFFMHLSPSFSEGLMFGAYHCLNLIYVLPLLSRVGKKNPLYVAPGLVCGFLLPGIVDGIAKEGMCADVTMGVVYGALLWAVYDEKGHTGIFYYSRLILYACVLVLTKSVGIEWAFFGIFFFILIRFKKEKEQEGCAKRLYPYLGIMTGAVLLTEGSWLLFCLWNRRVAKLTGAGIRIFTSGDFSFLQNSMEKMKIYWDGFMCYSMHGDDSGVVDLSSFALLVIFLVVIVLFSRFRYIQKWERNRFLLFVGITACMSYGIIFLGHITIFAGELQYLDPYVMAKSIARYGAPFTIGILYLLMGILIKKKKGTGYRICIAVILLTTSLPGAYQTLFGYRATVEQDVAQRNEMIDENAKIFLQTVAHAKAQKYEEDVLETRTLYLRNDKEIHWVKDTYVSFEASPVPVVYGGIASDTMTQGDMLKKIEESHADYLYADKVEGDCTHLFAGMLEEESFCYETLYRIVEENGTIKLRALK